MTDDLSIKLPENPVVREECLAHCNRGLDVWRNKEFTDFFLEIREAIKEEWNCSAHDLNVISGAKASTVSMWKRKFPEGYSKAGQLACICLCLKCDPRELKLPAETCVAVRSYYRTHFHWYPSGKSVVSSLMRFRADSRVHDIFTSIIEMSSADQTWVKQHHAGLDLLYSGLANDSSGSRQIVHDLQRTLIFPSDWPVGRNTISITLNCREFLKDCFYRWNRTPWKKRRYRNYLAAGEGIQSELYLALRGQTSDLACISLRFMEALSQKSLKEVGQNMLEQLKSNDAIDLLETAQRDQLDHYLEHVDIIAEKFFPTSFGELKKTLRYITDISMAYMPPAKKIDLISCLRSQVEGNTWPDGKVKLESRLTSLNGHSNSPNGHIRNDNRKTIRTVSALAYPDSFAQFLREVLQFMSRYGDIRVNCAPVSGTAFIHLQIANAHSRVFDFDKDGFDNQYPDCDGGRNLVSEELARDMPASPWKALCEIAAVMAEISCGYAVANSASSEGPYIMRFLLPCGTIIREY